MSNKGPLFDRLERRESRGDPGQKWGAFDHNRTEEDDQVTVTVAEVLTDLRRIVTEAVTAMAREQRSMAQELEELRAELAATRELLEKQEEV